MKNRIIYILLSVALLVVSCVKDITMEESHPDPENRSIGKVMMSAGTTENSITTRADGKTYYMPAAHRFVAKMYFKTTASGEVYDTLRYHTAWLKVDNGGAGNSLYWKNTYPATAQKEDTYHNDEFAPTFYWQNRKEHAFLAWTDLNRATSATGTYIHYDESAPYSSYQYHTGIKEWTWTEKYFMVHNLATPFTSLGNLRNAALDPAGTALNALTSNEAQDEQESFAAGLGALPRTSSNYQLHDGVPYVAYTVSRPDGYYLDSSYENTDDTHRKSQWYKLTTYDFDQKLPYTGDVSNRRTLSSGTYVVDGEGNLVAYQDADNKELYYQCDEYGFVLCEEKYVFCYQVYETNENKEVIDEYPAMAFDLTRGTKDSMAEQPDILQALTIDQIPKSAVMEANRVDLYFKHQFAQVQINLKNSADNSVLIRDDQIKNVELLGVTERGYMFTSMNPDGTVHAPIGFGSSTFKEVVATDFTDAQLETNPYGTTFDMFERAVPQDEKDLNKIVKSYECITFGRLQAIRITWQEDDYTGPEGNQVDGITHIATYRVPEKNDMGQSLRLLEAGKKYIWNMELRRGTLAVVRTEIIPWEENQEEYNADGFITIPSGGGQ